MDNGTSLTYYALVMPGTTFNYGDDFFQLTDGNATYTYALNISGGITAGEAKYCNISLTVHRTGIDMDTFTVGNWTEDKTGSGTATMDE